MLQIAIGDTMDWIVSRAKENPNLTTINRAVITKVEPATAAKRESIPIVVRHYNNLVTDDYPISKTTP